MNGLSKMGQGQRLVFVGEWISAPGQDGKSALDVVEKAAIEQAVADGHTLLNQQGVNIGMHEISNEGKRKHRGTLPRRLYQRLLPKRKWNS